MTPKAEAAPEEKASAEVDKLEFGIGCPRSRQWGTPSRQRCGGSVNCRLCLKGLYKRLSVLGTRSNHQIAGTSSGERVSEVEWNPSGFSGLHC